MTEKEKLGTKTYSFKEGNVATGKRRNEE